MGPVKHITPVTDRGTHLTESGFRAILVPLTSKNINWKYPAALAVPWIGSSEVNNLWSVSWVLRQGCGVFSAVCSIPPMSPLGDVDSARKKLRPGVGSCPWFFCCSLRGCEMGTAVAAATLLLPQRDLLQQGPNPAGRTEPAFRQHTPSFRQTSFPSPVSSLLSVGLGLGVEKLSHKRLPEIQWFCFPKYRMAPAQGQLSFCLWESTLGAVFRKHFSLFSGQCTFVGKTLPLFWTFFL